jgi:hypothetical protein
VATAAALPAGLLVLAGLLAAAGAAVSLPAPPPRRNKPG